jgi:hypothetical protein
MASDFNSETQILVLKEEYSVNVTEITITRPAFGGITYDEIRVFDPINTPQVEYADYFYSGFEFIFNIVDKPII